MWGQLEAAGLQTQLVERDFRPVVQLSKAASLSLSFPLCKTGVAKTATLESEEG